MQISVIGLYIAVSPYAYNAYNISTNLLRKTVHNPHWRTIPLQGTQLQTRAFQFGRIRESHLGRKYACCLTRIRCRAFRSR